MHIRGGKYFDHNRLVDFLADTAFIFTLKDKPKKGVSFDFSKIQEVSIINLLVFCKVVEFTYENNLFYMPTMQMNDVIEERLNFFGFSPLLEAYVKETDEEKALKKLSVRQVGGFLIAPQPLMRSDFSFRSKLNAVYLPGIQKYYSSVNNAISIIFTCLSELSLNFWAHATGDSHSILMAYGSKNKIEIGCADNGAGIVSTLKESLGSEYQDLDNVTILSKSIERGVTSKKGTNHMGYGLWLVSEIVKRMGGILGLYSEGAYLNVRGEKITKGACGYWKGSIVYLSLPLDKCFALDELMPIFENTVNINWD